MKETLKLTADQVKELPRAELEKMFLEQQSDLNVFIDAVTGLIRNLIAFRRNRHSGKIKIDLGKSARKIPQLIIQLRTNPEKLEADFAFLDTALNLVPKYSSANLDIEA